MGQVKKFYKNLRLQGKLLFLFIPTISLTMVFINVFSGEIISRILVKKSFDYTLDTMSLLTRQYNLYASIHGGDQDIALFSDETAGPQNKYFAIVNPEGIVVSAGEHNWLYKDISNTDYLNWIKDNNMKIKVFTVKTDLFVIVGSRLNADGYFLISRQPVEAILADNKAVTYSIYITAAICILLIICIVIVFSESITEPIHWLIAQTKEVSNGNLQGSINIDSNDEIGDLTTCFNTMLTRLVALIERIENEQKIVREYELSLLHAQIKPHFLYNTLESVRALILGSENRLAFETISNLGNFYKGILNGGSDILIIKEEISITRHYLKIQQVRHQGLFDFSILMEKEVENCRIPILSLQPIVENSIKHGLRGTGKKSMIKISAYRRGDTTIVDITDNGRGIEERRLPNLLQPTTEPGRKGGYGLRNIDERIKLYYGNDYGLVISSEAGTTVSISLPYNAAEERGNA